MSSKPFSFSSRIFGSTIARRLYISFAILVTLLVVMGVGSLVAQNTMDGEISRIVDTSFRISTLVTDIQNEVNELRVEFGEFLVEYQQGEEYDAAWARVEPMLTDMDELHEGIAELRTFAEAGDEHLVRLLENLNVVDAAIIELGAEAPNIGTDLQTLGNSTSTGLMGELFQNLDTVNNLSTGSGMIRVESTALDVFRPPVSYLIEQNDDYIAEFQTIVGEFQSAVSTSALQQARKTELLDSMSAVETTFNQIISLRNEINENIESLDEITEAIEPSVTALRVVAAAELDEALEDLAATQQIVLVFKVVVMALGIILGARLALYSVRSISEPLGRLVWVTKRVGEGDLNQRADLHRNDEIGRLGAAFDHMVGQLQDNMSNQVARAQVERVVAQYREVISRVAQGDLTAQLELDMLPGQTDASSDDLYQLGANLNLMVENLRSMTTQIRDTASAVARAVTEIEAATTQQLATTSEQDAAITQTMATVEEVRTTVNQTADRAQQVAQSSRQSVTASRQGEEIVLNTITGMETVQMRVNDIAETILSLSERTQQIGEIIDTVNGLAEQSKLLALNASIEAARAGEEGRGFAVVALEVRQLAEQSREATNRVHGILNEIQQATNTAVMVTEEGSKGAIEGMSLVERAGDTIRELGNVLEEAMQAATQIAASTHQQTSGMDQLAAAMSQIQQASIQAAASADQTEQNVRNIVSMSQQLEEAAARYQL